MCRLLRKTIRSQWAVRPMEELGVGSLSEKENLWDELFETPWDRKVKLHSVKFTFVPFTNSVISERSTDTEPDSDLQFGGMVTLLTLELSPATTPLAENGDALYETISQVLSFKVFDSAGRLCRLCISRLLQCGANTVTHVEI
jgi:hypothetical protein